MPAQPPRIVLDCTLTQQYAGEHAVGIVRTEREFAKVLVEDSCAAFVKYDPTSRTFRSLSRAYVRSVLSPDAEPVLRDRLDFESGGRFQFNAKDHYLHVGAPWYTPLMHSLAKLKKEGDVSYHQLVYDLVPLIVPEYCGSDTRDLFYSFIVSVTQLSDSAYGISERTVKDLEDFIETNGLRRPQLSRVTLGSAITDKHANTTSSSIRLDDGTLFRPGEDEPFVLYVSTLEPRKNHSLLLRCWSRLYREMGQETPRLIIVGRAWWGSNDFLQMLHQSLPYRTKRILHFSRVSDDQLSFLYRRAAFSVYPSFYEGWGLPISESLGYGTPCVSSNTSSMPEAARGLADLLSPDNVDQWMEKLTFLFKNPKVLEEKRKRIHDEYKFESWEKNMTAVIDEIKNGR